MATIHTAPSVSRADVLATIALAAPGDTVVVPPGTADWSGTNIIIQGITLQGPGKSAATPAIITAGSVEIWRSESFNTRLTGFRFTGTDRHFYAWKDGLAFVVDNCYFFNNAAEHVGDIYGNGGLVSRCDFVATPAHGADCFQLTLFNTPAAAASWAAPHSMGTADTTGQMNTYFEDCTWSGFREVAGDIDEGARAVYRKCTFTDSSLVVHGGGSGTSGNDSSAYGGKHLEVYDCTFVRANGEEPINKWVWWRGGTGVFANNVVPRCDSSSYPGKAELRLTVGCPGPYPITYQIGQSQTPADSTPDYPLLIFGNTGLGTTDPDFILIGENPSAACATASSYIQEGRDYMTSNSWGWVAYPYPHPLRLDDDTDGGNGGGGVATIGGDSGTARYGAIYGGEISNIEVDLSGGGLDIKSRVGDEFEMGVFFDYADLTGYEFAALAVLDPPPLSRVFPIVVEEHDLSVGLILVKLSNIDTQKIGPVADKPWFLKWKNPAGSWRTVMMGKLCINRNY